MRLLKTIKKITCTGWACGLGMMLVDFAFMPARDFAFTRMFSFGMCLSGLSVLAYVCLKSWIADQDN